MIDRYQIQHYLLPYSFIITVFYIAFLTTLTVAYAKSKNGPILRSLHKDPVFVNAEGKWAWWFYKRYKRNLECIRTNEKKIKAIRDEISYYGGTIARNQKQHDVTQMRQELEDAEKKLRRCQDKLAKLKAKWNKLLRFRVGGELSLAQKLVKVRIYRSQNDIKETTMDELEYRIRERYSTDSYVLEVLHSNSTKTKNTHKISSQIPSTLTKTNNTQMVKKPSQIVIEMLSGLSDKKQQAVLKKLNIRPPRSLFDCLCREAHYGSSTTRQFYHPDTLGEFNPAYSCQHPGPPCIVAGFGCFRNPLPSDPKIWETCIKYHRIGVTKDKNGKSVPGSGKRLDELILEKLSARSTQ